MPCGGFGERVVNTMAESKNYIVQPQEGGNILISEDVIASIASLAVREVEGVYGLSATQTLDLTAILGKKNLSSGIRVTLQDNVIDIACNLVVRMGQPVMTCLLYTSDAADVNVTVCGGAAPKAEQA